MGCWRLRRSLPDRTASLVSKWERGEKKPGGPSLKLLALADRKGIDAIL